MNTALWVVQVVLAVLYVIAGLGKIMGQGPMLEKMMPGFSLALIRLVGLGEALAGLGLVLPAAARGWAAVAGWAGAILAAEAVVFVVYHLGTGLMCPPEPRWSWASWPLLWPGDGSNRGIWLTVNEPGWLAERFEENRSTCWSSVFRSPGSRPRASPVRPRTRQTAPPRRASARPAR